MQGAGGQTKEAELLRRLLALALAAPAPAWERPAPELLRGAAAAYLLLDRRPGYDAESFVMGMLEPLLQTLSRTSEHHSVAERQRVRGRVLWRATVAARAAEGDEDGLYVYREVRRRYDSPENRLLRLLVEQLAGALRLVPAPLREGGCYQPGAGAAPLPAAPRLVAMEATLRRAQTSPWLREVGLPERASDEQMRRAEGSRHEGYGAAARLYRRYAQLSAPAGWRPALAAAGRRVLLLPASPDGAGEPWLALAASLLREAIRG